ncbi:MAG: hypothetical protein VYA34_06470 [Myxococcota bacterium]|nr:hypothetical protein [Myxococcota bacterium]
MNRTQETDHSVEATPKDTGFAIPNPKDARLTPTAFSTLLKRIK